MSMSDDEIASDACEICGSDDNVGLAQCTDDRRRRICAECVDELIAERPPRELLN